MSYEVDFQNYKLMREGAKKIEGELLFKLTEKCQQNSWLKIAGIDFEPDGFCCESDYPYYLEEYDDIGLLKLFFEHGNWGIRSAVKYKDLIFVNQVNGGDEWWTLRIFNNDLFAFESISCGRIIRRDISDGTKCFDDLILRLLKATKEELKSLVY